MKHQQTLCARSSPIGDKKTLSLLLTARKTRDLKATGKTAYLHSLHPEAEDLGSADHIRSLHLPPPSPAHLPVSGKAAHNCLHCCASCIYRAAVPLPPACAYQATAPHHTMSDSPSHHIGHVDALNLTVSLCLCYTLCIALVRLWIRRGAFGVDDLVVLAATLVTLGHTGSSYAGLAAGLGKPWTDIRESKDLAKLNTVRTHLPNHG
jgi:hypothetical protein